MPLLLACPDKHFKKDMQDHHCLNGVARQALHAVEPSSTTVDYMDSIDTASDTGLTGSTVRLTVLPLVMVEMVIMCQPPSRGALTVLRSLLEPTTPSAQRRNRVTRMAHSGSQEAAAAQSPCPTRWCQDLGQWRASSGLVPSHRTAELKMAQRGCRFWLRFVIAILQVFLACLLQE